jgi:hypothetical protein
MAVRHERAGEGSGLIELRPVFHSGNGVAVDFPLGTRILRLGDAHVRVLNA